MTNGQPGRRHLRDEGQPRVGQGGPATAAYLRRGGGPLPADPSTAKRIIRQAGNGRLHKQPAASPRRPPPRPPGLPGPHLPRLPPQITLSSDAAASWAEAAVGAAGRFRYVERLQGLRVQQKSGVVCL